MKLDESFFVPYSTPPPSGVDDQLWTEAAQEIQKDLSLLVRLSHEPFWDVVTSNSSLLPCLESYLRFGPRTYDFELGGPSSKDRSALLSDIHRLVFLVFSRLACFRRVNLKTRSPEDILAFLVKRRVFDAANIIDLCSMYGWVGGGGGNEKEVGRLVDMVLQEAPIAKELKKVVDLTPTVFNDVADELGVCVGASAAAGPSPVAALSPLLSLSSLSDVVLFLCDQAAGLSSLAEFHKASAELMHSRGMEVTLAAFYEAAFPVLVEGLRGAAAEAGDGDLREALRLRIEWVREVFVKLVRRLVSVTCIEPLLEKSGEYAGKECPLADDYFQVMSSLASEAIFIQDYLSYYPFDEDLELFDQCNVKTDEMTKNYVLDAIKKVTEAVEKEGSKRPETLGEETSFVNGEAAQHYRRTPQTPPASPVLEMQKKKVTGAKLESLITQVTDLLSDLGRGFVHACLEKFDYDPELTINAILEDQLPPELVGLDRASQSYWKPLAESSGFDADTEENDDDEEEEEVDQELLKIKAIHKGKREDLNPQEMLNRPIRLTDAERERYWQYGNTTEFEPGQSLVAAAALDDDDEYDDTYDAVPEFLAEDPTAVESKAPAVPFQIEPLNEKKNRGPKNWGQSDDEDEDEDGQKRPRDIFCDNPEDVRKRYEQRRGGYRGTSGNMPPSRDVKGAPKGAGQDEATLRNRRKKEQNKSVAGNHNRRSQAQWKRREF